MFYFKPFFFCFFSIDDILKPKITEEPKTQVAIKGANLTLTCIATSSSLSHFTISWKRDNIDLSTDMYAVLYNTSDVLNNSMVVSELKIMHVDKDIAGKYQCIASNEYGSTFSSRSRISVASKLNVNCFLFIEIF